MHAFISVRLRFHNTFHICIYLGSISSLIVSLRSLPYTTSLKVDSSASLTCHDPRDLGPGGVGGSLLRSRTGRSHVTLPVPTRLLQTDIHSFLGVLRFCLLGPMSLSFSCHCIRCTNHRREHSQENESHTLIGLFPRKECMSV